MCFLAATLNTSPQMLRFNHGLRPKAPPSWRGLSRSVGSPNLYLVWSTMVAVPALVITESTADLASALLTYVSSLGYESKGS